MQQNKPDLTGSEPILVALLRRPRQLALWTLGAAVLVFAMVAWSISDSTGKYMSESRVLFSDARVTDSRLSMAASALSMDLGGGRAGEETVELYLELFRSAEIQRQAARRVAAGEVETQRPLPAGIDPNRLSRQVQGEVSAVASRAGIVTVQVRLDDGVLAEAMNAALLDVVSDFLHEHRRGRAQAERAFIEERLVEARRELLAAENQYQQFLQANRRLDNSPRLAFEASRLEREEQLRQQLYANLAVAYDRARLDEVGRPPVVAVLEAPWSRPASGRGIWVGAALFALVAGALLAVIAFLAFEYGRGLIQDHARTEPA